MEGQRTKGQRPLHPAVTAEKGKTQHLSHIDTAWISGLFLCLGLPAPHLYTGPQREMEYETPHLDTAHASFQPWQPSVQQPFPSCRAPPTRLPLSGNKSVQKLAILGPLRWQRWIGRCKKTNGKLLFVYEHSSCKKVTFLFLLLKIWSNPHQAVTGGYWQWLGLPKIFTTDFGFSFFKKKKKK